MKSVRESSTRKKKEERLDELVSEPRIPVSASEPLPSKDDSAWAYPPAEGGEAPADLAPIVGANLRRLRIRRGLSLEKLAQRSGVSRAMLGQVELGQSAPTINVLWKIARALDVTFATLIQAREAGGTTVLKHAAAKVLTSHGGHFSSRALFPFDGPRRAEFYELRLAAGATESADAHAPGTVENLVVVERPGHAETHRLDAGDAIVFEADCPHSYISVGGRDCLMYLVMTYAEEIG